MIGDRIIVAVALGVLLAGCGPGGPGTPAAAPGARTLQMSVREAFERLTPADVQARIKAGDRVLIVDVRPAEDYGAAHIAGAINAPLRQINAMEAALPKDTLLVLYCACPSEGSSIAAAYALNQQLGYTRLAVLVGGIKGWQAAGLQTASGTE